MTNAEGVSDEFMRGIVVVLIAIAGVVEISRMVENGGEKEKHGGKDSRANEPAEVTSGAGRLRESESGD